MQSFDFKKFLPTILIVGGFLVISFLFCYPQLSGKVLNQHDTMSWIGMAKEGKDYYEKTGDNVMWSNTMFGGMPTYTYYMPVSNNYVYQVQEVLTKTIGTPALFFFLALLGFYILLRALSVDRWLAAIGAVAYAFSTYNIIIIGAGHNTKMFAMGYFPAVLAGLFYIYQSRWWRGIPVLGLSLALMISTGHYQILYYAMIVVVFAVLGMFAIALKNNEIKTFIMSSVIALVTALIAIGPSMASVLPTLEYNKETMRGGISELTINKHDKNKTSGLDKEYAFRWSNSLGETFCLMIPYLYGGSSDEPIENAEKSAELVGSQASRLPLYWGPQPFLSGPVYFGAIICFLFILGCMVIRSPHKWWLIAATALSIVMSWGNHFAGFNYLLFDSLPMLNKFRTPSMVLVIAEVTFPLMAIWGIQEIISGNQDKAALLKKLKIAAGITIGLCIILGVGGSMFFNYSGVSDIELPKQLLPALREDRADFAMKSALISAVYIALATTIIWLFLKSTIKNVMVVIMGLGLLIAIDLISVDNKYLGEDHYVDAADFEANFQPRPVDQEIMKDPDPYYRVLDISKNTYNDAIQSYFHKSVGGYSPAKLERYQDLIDVHMSAGKYNAQVLNMLNTKYIIYPAGDKGQVAVMQNKEAAGNGWFVNDVKWANTADEEILSLNAHKLGDTATPGEFEPKKTAVIRNTFKNDLNGYDFGKDSAAYVKLAKYGLNDLSFTSSNSKNGVAIFADIYYPYGWHAYVDGKETPIMKADYVLRAIKIPAGQHKIDFKFHPDSYYTGNKIALISSLLLFFACGFSIFQLFRKDKNADIK